MTIQNSSDANDRNPETQEAQIEKMMDREGLDREQSFTQLGITPEFIWYESEILVRDMGAWESRFKRLVSVMEQRHKDHLKMIGDLMKENRTLKQKLQEKDQ